VRHKQKKQNVPTEKFSSDRSFLKRQYVKKNYNKQYIDFLTDSVVTSGVIVGGILLPGHQLLRVEQLPVGPSSNLVHDSRLQVNEDGPVKKICCTFLSSISNTS